MPAPESPLALTRRARRIERVLAETYPDARCELDFDDLVRLDFLYLERWSVGLDLAILLKTIPTVMFGIGAK